MSEDSSQSGAGADAGIGYELDGNVAIVSIDDGKANALSPQLIAAIQAALDRAESEARAVLLIGRPGRFSAGFHLPTLQKGGDDLLGLVTAGAELALRLYGSPLPTGIACSGHAIAMGAILLMAADHRTGTEGDFKIGLNEVAIGMTLPRFGVEFANERLSKRHRARAVLGAELYGPAAAVDAGFLDEVVAPDALRERALARMAVLAELPARAYAETKQRLRGAAIDRIRKSLSDPL